MASYDRAKEIIRRACPSAVFRAQAPAEWQGDFLLPNRLIEYFRDFGPVDVTINGYGNPYFLPRLAQLWTFQAGYRYDPRTHERFTEWDDDWLVIADEGGDPFILSRSSGNILHAYHGEGVWEPAEMFESLAEMAMTFAIIGDIVAAAGRALTDDDSLILSRYRQEALTRICECLGSQERGGAVVSMLEWS
jgi:hypothetical protein